jgi:type III restriction enzyme
VGDEKLTTNDDIREFNRLDTEGSDKQFILLVNKGREGLELSVPFRRCPVPRAESPGLRAAGHDALPAFAIGRPSTRHVFLSEDNLNILNDELHQNFRISADELHQAASDRERVRIHVDTSGQDQTGSCAQAVP